ncbi:hydantoinase B/oxoprolinase family protein [Roseiflexus castenholzii]|jgi:N-methylhydantoinase B/acetone carboxylase alpha subunit|uniref:Hydantoinase B/oxoprolinase n=1 Tax=Roseiflexus castenholzii (strain DSM 13941 / HLO8) TaxID=383372 RepID=A7NK49_ROSCS|nr:hydantoinase B/oxoprolinase family protein [Roseiflexus castenholzii]ABU57869.1 Hydantoinase B/oxoprolinase [Roseiflexus castenholzii DSM 13941]
MTIMTDTTASAGIGWNGRTLRSMLEESERLFAETGRYYGIERLTLKEEDPIRYEKLFSRLRGGMVNARETALNISASPIVREIGELCFALYTPEGDSITLSTGIMVHVHTMSDAIKWMIRNNYEENPGIEDGDIFCNNDAFIGDVHNADVQDILPIFWEGELIGWAAGVTHVIDVGAPLPSGMPMGPIHRYEDGFMLSAQKVGSKNRLHRDYVLRCQTAVRLPFYWMLDQQTRIAGCQMIKEAVHRVIREEGIETYKRFIREVIEDGRRSFVQRVRELTIPGTYSVPSFMDVTFGGEAGRLSPEAAKDTLMHAPLTVEIGSKGEFKVSFEGASKWGYHSFNAPPSAMQGGLWVLLTQTLVPNDKVNDGAYFAIQNNLPYGSWANPDNKFCSVSIAWVYLIPGYSGIFRALSMAYVGRGYLEEVIAGYPGTWNMTQGGGPNHYGQPGAWTNFEMSSCGTSARYVMDGEDTCAAMWNPEGDMGDVEAWEILEPLLYLSRRIRPNSFGPGKFRGGSGFESIRMVYNTPTQVLYNLGEGNVFLGTGLFGGYPAFAGYRQSVKHTDMARRIAHQLPYPISDEDPENSQMVAHVEGVLERDKRTIHLPDPHAEYDLYLSVLRGGNGLGDVLERDPAAVVRDLNEGYLLPRFAASTYGVVAFQNAAGEWELDAEATEERRAAMRRERIEQSIPVDEWMAQQRTRVVQKNFIEPVRQMYQESMSLSPTWAAHFRSFWGLDDDWSL